MEKIELKHLVGYLPYNLKFATSSGKLTKISYSFGGIHITKPSHHPMKSDRIFTLSESCFLRNYKPILRPLSDLIKQTLIAILCKKAVASIWGHEDFDFIIKSYHEIGSDYGIVATSDDWRIGFSVEFERQKNFKLTIGRFGQENPPSLMLDKLELFNWLFENHFDVFGLIDAGLAVDINNIS